MNTEPKEPTIEEIRDRQLQQLNDLMAAMYKTGALNATQIIGIKSAITAFADTVEMDKVEG
jgi:hypothetical protein